MYTISWNVDDALPEWLAIVFVALSVLPAPTTLFVLGRDATNAIRPIKTRADDVEARTSVRM